MPAADDDDLPGEAAPPQPTPKTKPQPATPPVEEETEPEPKPTPKKHEHTERLVTIAKSMGFSQRDLDSHPSSAIWEEIDRLNRLHAARQPSNPAPAAKEPDPEDDVEAFLKTCEDEPTAKMIRALAKKADQKDVREKLAKLDQLEAAEKARTTRALDEAIDDSFAGLPDEYKPLVGEGDMAELTDHGAKGWRNAIYAEAKITAADSPRAIKRKIAAAAATLAGERVKGKKKPAEEEASAYGGEEAVAKPPKKEAPRAANGRFSAEEFEAGNLVRPNGKKTGVDQLSPVRGMQRLLKEAGDPRGDRSIIDMDDDDLP